MKAIVKVVKFFLFLTLSLAVAVAALYTLDRMRVLQLSSVISKVAKIEYLIVVIAVAVVLLVAYLIISKRRKVAQSTDEKAEAIPSVDLSPLQQSLLNEKNALSNIACLIDKHGYNEECVDALMERLPEVENVLAEITRFAEFDPSQAWDKHCLDLVRNVRAKLSETLMDVTITQPEFEVILIDCNKLLHEVVGSPTEEFMRKKSSEKSSPSSDFADDRTVAIIDERGEAADISGASQDPARAVQRSETAAQIVRRRATISLSDLKKKEYETTYIPSSKGFNSKTQGNLGWGEDYGGISAQFKINTLASPQQQEMLRRSVPQTSHQIIIQQNQDPQIRKQPKPIGKIIGYIALGLVGVAIIVVAVIAILNNAATLE